MQFIQCEVFESRKANSSRTISLDSSTTVDDISMIISLENTVNFASFDRVNKKTSGVITLAVPMNF